MIEEESLRNRLKEYQSYIREWEGRISHRKERINVLRKEISDLEDSLHKFNSIKDKIEKLLLLEKPFDEKLIEAREWMVKIIQEAGDKNTTAERRKDLDILYKNETEKLKQMLCDHRLVIKHHAYMTYALQKGCCRCLVCGYEEFGGADIFLGVNKNWFSNILTDDGTRIVELMNKEDFDNFDSWQSLPEIIQWFKERYKI